MDDKIKGSLEANPGAEAYNIGDYVFVVQAPSEAQYDRFLDGSMKKPSAAIANLVEAVTVHPDAKTRSAIFAKQPAIRSKVLEIAIDRAGADVGVSKISGK